MKCHEEILECIRLSGVPRRFKVRSDVAINGVGKTFKTNTNDIYIRHPPLTSRCRRIVKCVLFDLLPGRLFNWHMLICLATVWDWFSINNGPLIHRIICLLW